MTLEKAMELLPKQTSGWTGRIDYYSAEALLAKVYLTKAGLSGSLNNDDLQKAAAYAEDVITNSAAAQNTLAGYFNVFDRLLVVVHCDSSINWLKLQTHFSKVLQVREILLPQGFKYRDCHGIAQI